MVKNLVIVESPAKAKTISKYLSNDYIVKASMGHIIDLPTKELGVDVDNNFNPTYQVSKEKKKIVTELKELAKNAEKIWLATDEDREGEAISWHIQSALKIKNENYERIVFHEITKTAILKAIENPRKIDLNLVNAQQARRVIDRLVGYKLSPLLWKKIRTGLSAGRVQSVAVRFVVEREEEIKKFEAKEQWKIKGIGEHSQKSIPVTLSTINNKKAEITAIEQVKKVINEIFSNPEIQEKINAKTNNKEIQITIPNDFLLKVFDVKKTISRRNPSVPFTTSTLQQEAHRKFGLPVAITMKLAQQLYEGIDMDHDRIALITYMRTDSLNISNESLEQITEYIKKNMGADYALPKHRVFKTKSKGAQEAHEAIRPININLTPESLANKLDPQLLKLYTLIWKRTVATQMPEAEIENTIISYHANDDTKYVFETVGKVIKFDGFMKLYIEDTDDEKEEDEDSLLPNIKINDIIPLQAMDALQAFTKPPARYTEASLVKKLESEGVGRPSTYAPTISTIVARGYIEKEKKFLVPTEIAFIVTNFLKEYFQDIISYKFTANIEESFDDIAVGKTEWVSMIRDFYEPFAKQLDHTYKTAKKHVEETDKICPECKNPLVIRISKYGKFLSCSKFPECKYTEKIEGEQALDVPRDENEKISEEKCPKCGKNMVYKKGRFGEFLACSDYPTCKSTKSEKKVIREKACPECKSDIVEKRTKKGKIFYGCDSFPKCKYAVWNLEDLDK
ncbi:MAG: type I DNA topoisomerase [Candidatus Margulisbacteria bacterium]|nr:type I DNA topoisomerase [Candidatus Margulisiibacteriota bacterium]